jgi:glycerol kinase
MQGHILAIDQGTTGSTALVVETGEGKGSGTGGTGAGRTIGRATTEFPQHFPKPGWVSHDVGEIWESVRKSVTEAIRSAGVGPDSIAAIGITNQRETTVVWDKATRKPIDLAIVWQCRRTADVCNELKKDAAVVARVREKTGLVIDAYFSATKIA